MTRRIEINPVTRIEGHAKVHIDLSDSGQVEAVFLHVLEFRGFERFVEGMQVELMPTITTRICGTCPHAHHLVAAKALDQIFDAPPPPAAIRLRELLNAGSFIHSHAIHFFALAGPDLFLGIDAPAEKRNLVALLEAAPDLAKKALKLRSIGQRISEIVGGRGAHPVTCVAGGIAAGLDANSRDQLRRITLDAVELAQLALREGKAALEKQTDLMVAFPLNTHNLGNTKGGALDFYDGLLRMKRADDSLALDFPAQDYRKLLSEEALHYTYAKRVIFKDPNQGPSEYRVGPLARINVADRISTPLAQAALEEFRQRFGLPCPMPVLGHYARLIELLYAAELAAEIANDDSIMSKELRTPARGTPKNAVAHIEAPRGVLIHDYEVDSNAMVQKANFLVATQHNLSSINATMKSAAEKFLTRSDGELLNGIEFAIRCYDPCLSCSTHQTGSMPLDVVIGSAGRELRRIRR